MKRSFRAVCVLVGVLMLLTVTSLFSLPKAHALYNTGNLPAPKWWNNGQDICDSTHYNNDSQNPTHIPAARLGGSTGISYRGVYPCGPMPRNGKPQVLVSFYTGATPEIERMCTEL